MSEIVQENITKSEECNRGFKNYRENLIFLSILFYFMVVFLQSVEHNGLVHTIVGEYQFKGILLDFHYYTPILYSLVWLFVFIPRYRQKSIPYFILIWACNEAFFNIYYSVFYPANFASLGHLANQIYLLILSTLAIYILIKVRPFRYPEFRLFLMSLAFPIFVIMWTFNGLPLMVGIWSNIGINGFIWEFAYQITLILTFLGVLKKQ